MKGSKSMTIVLDPRFWVVVLSLMIFVSAARATDFTQSLIGVTGEVLFQPGDDCLPQPPDKPPLVAGKTCSKSELTLGDVAVSALESLLEGDRNEDTKKRFDRDQLARKVYKQKEVTLSSEEISQIKERIGKVYAPSVVGAAWPLLDPSLAGK